MGRDGQGGVGGGDAGLLLFSRGVSAFTVYSLECCSCKTHLGEARGRLLGLG